MGISLTIRSWLDLAGLLLLWQMLLWFASFSCLEFKMVDVREFTILYTVFVNYFNLESRGFFIRL